MDQDVIVSKKKKNNFLPLFYFLISMLLVGYFLVSAIMRYQRYSYSGQSFLGYLLPTLPGVLGVLFIVVANIWIIVQTAAAKKERLIIEGDRVHLTTKKGVTTTYEIKDLFSATIQGAALIVDGPGLKYVITNLENNQLLHKVLTEKMLRARKPAPSAQKPSAPAEVSGGQNYYSPYTSSYGAPIAAPTAASSASSEAEAIRKYKDLLDQGLITQEEFDAKKRQILGL